MATLVRWEPLREIGALQNEMSRFMNGLLEGNGRTNQSWIPALDRGETENDVVYAVDLPGISEDKISVELDDGALTISAERERTQEESDERLYRYERRYGTFSRTVGVPQGVTESDISADYKNGVLEVHVKKPEQPKPKRIQIGSGAGGTIEGQSEQKSLLSHRSRRRAAEVAPRLRGAEVPIDGGNFREDDQPPRVEPAREQRRRRVLVDHGVHAAEPASAADDGDPAAAAGDHHRAL